ncbi:MAG: ferredoxin, partial [Clostridiales bacterium]|nr:ferredoxin [Clostridiales bacterium]
ENAYLARTKTKRMSQNEPDIRPDSDVLGQHDLNSFGWSEPVTYEPVYRLGENIFESMENMEKVETILEALPGLDCGCCGSPTCKALATDIVTSNRDATIGDCIFLTRDLS